MTSKFAWRSAALAAVVTGLVSVGSPAVAAPVVEQTTESYSISRIAKPQEKGWVTASCRKAATPYLIGVHFTTKPFAVAKNEKYLEYTDFTHSADGRSASMEFFNSQPLTTPWRDQIGIQVKANYTCSNVRPPEPPKPVFVKSAVLPAFSEVFLKVGCPAILPTVVESEELHENGVIPYTPEISGGEVKQGWLSMIPNEGVVDLLVRCGP